MNLFRSKNLQNCYILEDELHLILNRPIYSEIGNSHACQRYYTNMSSMYKFVELRMLNGIFETVKLTSILKTVCHCFVCLVNKLLKWAERSVFLLHNIRITCPCDLYPLAPNFYMIKLRFTGVYIFFLFLL